jgi:hypothetical protein
VSGWLARFLISDLAASSMSPQNKRFNTGQSVGTYQGYPLRDWYRADSW